METNNLTLRQQLILMMAERSVSKYGTQELTDGNIARIREIADRLCEGIGEEPNEEPQTKQNKEYPPFNKHMSEKTIKRLRYNGITTPEELAEHDFEDGHIYGFKPNIELLQYAMYAGIKLRNYYYF